MHNTVFSYGCDETELITMAAAGFIADPKCLRNKELQQIR
jgi:hypothetical protein